MDSEKGFGGILYENYSKERPKIYRYLLRPLYFVQGSTVEAQKAPTLGSPRQLSRPLAREAHKGSHLPPAALRFRIFLVTTMAAWFWV